MNTRLLAWQKLRTVSEAVENTVAKSLQARHGIGMSEFRALQLLAASEAGELRMQELAAALGLNQSSVSRLVERLERGGYTVRDTCPDDKRGIYSVITRPGKRKLQQIEPEVEQWLLDALDAARADPASKRLIDAVLRVAA